MIVTSFTRSALKVRRDRRKMTADGWEYVGERGGQLWELHRGGRTRHRIVDVRIAACGKALWIKTAEAMTMADEVAAFLEEIGL